MTHCKRPPAGWLVCWCPECNYVELLSPLMSGDPQHYHDNDPNLHRSHVYEVRRTKRRKDKER